MKKKIYKLTALGAAALMAVSLTGCGGGRSSGDGTAEGKTKITVIRAVNNLESADSQEVQKVEDAVNDYIADKLDVEIEMIEISGGEYSDKCNLNLANGEINLFWTASWLGAVSCDSLVQANAVYDISDLLPGSVLYDSMPESVWEASEYSGIKYFIPVYKEIAEGYDILFRGDLVEKYDWDLDEVKELKDLEPILEDCLNDDSVTAPILLQSTMGTKFLIDQFDFIGDGDLFGVDRKTNEVVNIVGTDEYRELCLLMSRWGEKGYILEGDATKSTPSGAIYSDYWGLSWWTDVPNNDEASTRFGRDTNVAHLTKDWISSNTTLGSCYAISATSTEAEAQACIDFLGLLYTDNELADIFTYGIEGTDFDYDEDGFVVKKGELFNHSAWEACSVRSVTPEFGDPADKAEMTDAFNEAGEVSVAAGFRLDKEPIEAELAACSNISERYGYVLENGGFREDEVDKTLKTYQKELDEAGYQKVLEEVTRQYEEWKAQERP